MFRETPPRTLGPVPTPSLLQGTGRRSATLTGGFAVIATRPPDHPRSVGNLQDSCAAGLAAVPDADDQDDELRVGDLVDDPVIAD